MTTKNTALVGVIMGSQSDYEKMEAALTTLKEFSIPHEVKIVSAHRTPDLMVDYARTASSRGLKAIIAGAGGAAHLPGMVASLTTLPVIGVPIALKHLDGLDSMLSILQMPRGVPVATVAIDNSQNAALLAIRMLGAHDASIQNEIAAYAKEQEKKVASWNAALEKA